MEETYQMDKENESIGDPFVVAVTGGIASGKTSVCEFFYDIFNIETIDTDRLSREAVAPGSKCLEEIISVFGKKVIDNTGNLNRPLMRKIIFEDKSLKQKLENIIHPKVKKLVDSKIRKITGKYCLLGIPLLFSKTQDSRIKRILVIDCEEDIQIKRAMARDNLNKEDIERVISSQASRKQRLTLADDIISNQGTLTELKEKIVALHKLYSSLSDKR